MIRYALRCREGHDFESWFQSGAAFDTLCASGHLACPACGGTDIEKALMAPKVAVRGDSGSAVVPPDPSPKPKGPPLPSRTQGVLSAPSDSAAAQAIDHLRRAVEASSEDTGRNFATEARAIHEGTAPNRAIRGEATAEQTRALLADGIKVVPLPFRDLKKAN